MLHEAIWVALSGHDVIRLFRFDHCCSLQCSHRVSSLMSSVPTAAAATSGARTNLLFFVAAISGPAGCGRYLLCAVA